MPASNGPTLVRSFTYCLAANMRMSRCWRPRERFYHQAQQV
jgi:hypothetical protein